jgi:hypothetical protein
VNFNGKRILVTDGTDSMGSCTVRELLKFDANDSKLSLVELIIGKPPIYRYKNRHLLSILLRTFGNGGRPSKIMKSVDCMITVIITYIISRSRPLIAEE